MARIRAALVATAVLVVASGGLAASSLAPAAEAAGTHRAMVVVDTGGTTYKKVITFSSDSVTGIQALDLAGAQPVVYSFAGQGGAVCRLFGVGRDAGPNCLGGADGDNRYWAYFRAPAGTTAFVYSRSGAGSTQVHDGDVEGWRFGTGTAPAYAALPPVVTTTTAAAPPPTVAPHTGGGNPTSTPPPGAPTGGAAATAPAMNLDPGALAAYLATTTTITAAPGASGPALHASGGDTTEVAGKRAVRSVKGSVMQDPGSTGGGGGAGSFVVFAVVAVALVGGGLLLRRSRRRPVP